MPLFVKGSKLKESHEPVSPRKVKTSIGHQTQTWQGRQYGRHPGHLVTVSLTPTVKICARATAHMPSIDQKRIQSAPASRSPPANQRTLGLLAQHQQAQNNRRLELLLARATPSVVNAAALGESVLFEKAGITKEYFENAENVINWNTLARVLSTKLDIEVDSPRIQHYYLPVYLWIKNKLADHRKANKGGPLCVGLSAPQGCGKTTLVTAFEELFESEDMTCVSVSLDDFYLTRKEQVALAEGHSSNELLQVRGNAGTHDVPMAMDVIQKIKNVSGDEVKVPCYDKSAFEGKGDRHKEDKWRSYNPSKVDVVLYEGWMQGFTAVEDDMTTAGSEVHSGIPEINAFLKQGGYDKMWELMDAWLIIQVKDLECIFKWRLQAEKAMKQALGEDKGMSDEEVKAFVDKYIPAYKVYLPQLYNIDNHQKNLGCKSNDDVFMFEVDAMRSPVPSS